MKHVKKYENFELEDDSKDLEEVFNSITNVIRTNTLTVMLYDKSRDQFGQIITDAIHNIYLNNSETKELTKLISKSDPVLVLKWLLEIHRIRGYNKLKLDIEKSLKDESDSNSKADWKFGLSLKIDLEISFEETKVHLKFTDLEILGSDKYKVGKLDIDDSLDFFNLYKDNVELLKTYDKNLLLDYLILKYN